LLGVLKVTHYILRFTKVLNKKKLSEQWKVSTTVPVYSKGDKTDCGNYRGISLLPITDKILSNILLSKLNPYVDEITGDHQCGS